MARIRTRHASTIRADEKEAVAELAEQLALDRTSVVLFFCSPTYDLPRLASYMRAFDVPVIGCTTSGQIGPAGFQPTGITAVSIASAELTVTPHGIRPLSTCREAAMRIAELDQVRRDAKGPRAFGLLLVDGLSMKEEGLTASLYQSLGQVPIIGGSAGDDLAFERTHVYFDGEFHTDAAVFALFETTLPFATFKFQHFVPTAKRLAITAADSERRVVLEINGLPAAEAYALAVGVPVDALESSTFSKHPVMLQIGDEYYVRSIQKVNPDGSMTFYCAIEEGLVLRIGEGVDALQTVERAFSSINESVANPELVIGCDCILRRLELEQTGLASEIGRFFADNRVIGFSTYGEQFNAVHVNQTFTGIAIGGGP